MFIYIVIFLLSLLFFEIGIRRLDNDSEVFPTSYLWIGLSMALPVILAALRSENIGEDVMVYVIPTFDLVIDSDNFIDVFDDSEVEVLYVLLAYVAKSISTDLWSILMLTELCVVVPFWIAFIKLREKINPTFALFLFYSVLFNHTLNMMRQSIALGLVLLAVAYMLNNKKVWMVFWLCVAFGFHKSVVLGMTLPLIYLFSRNYPLYKNKLLYVCLFFGLMFVASSFASFIVFLIDEGILDLKYLVYTEAGVIDAKISKSSLVIVFIEFLILFKATISYGEQYIDLNFYFLCGVITVLFCLTGYVVAHLARISWYFHIISFLSLPYVLSNPYLFGIYKYIRWAFVSLLCFYWWFAFVLSGESNTMPYEFQYEINEGDHIRYTSDQQ